MQSALSDHFYSIYVHKYAFYKGFFLNCMENNRWVDTKSKVWRVGKWCVECQCEMEKKEYDYCMLKIQFGVKQIS